jgi:hypothetical protein
MASADAPSHVDLAGLYEQLRRRALDGGWGGPGCALLQRDGMKSWIETCLRIPRPSVPVCPPHEAATNIPSCGDLVQLIAAMVLEIHQQGAMS